MAEASWPFYGVETNEVQFSKWARSLALSGIVSGLAVTPGTGLQVAVAAGTGLVRGVFFENDSTRTLAIAAAPASGTRLDALVLRLDQTANSITLVTKTGSTGALPSFTRDETTWELHLATISVAAGTAAITAGMITELKPSTGLRVITYATTTRPTPEESLALGFDTTAKRLELWTGGAWSNLFDFSNMSGTLPVSKGGTGATSASGARTNLGAAAASDVAALQSDMDAVELAVAGKAPMSHNHSAGDITSGTLPIARGGTGATSAKAAREALQIYVQPTSPSHLKGRLWVPGSALV